MILPSSSSSSSSIIPTSPHSSNGNQHHLLKALFLPSTTHLKPPSSANIKNGTNNNKGVRISSASASLLQRYPVLFDAGRVCIFYALLKAGLAGSPSNPFISSSSSSSSSAADFPVDGDDLGFSKWFESFQGRSEDNKASDKRKLVSKWHPTTKGTLKRSYRVPSKTEGRRLLKAITSLLSDDDHFVDASSHKGCQIRRESAHGESVCCNNVRALFDELPTPHLVVEITSFPAGPLTDKDYVKAEKLETVLRSGSSI